MEHKNNDRKGIDRFNLPLTINQKIWFLFLLPTAFCCIIYIADVATDIALVERHFTEDRCLAGAVTVILIYAPPIVYFILTIMDSKKWPEPEKDTLKKVRWIAKELGLLVFFPIYAIHRYGSFNYCVAREISVQCKQFQITLLFIF